MKNFVTLLFAFLFCWNLIAQERAVVQFQTEEMVYDSYFSSKGTHFYSTRWKAEMPLKNAEPFPAVSVVWKNEDEKWDGLLIFYYRSSDRTWRSYLIEPDEHSETNPEKFVSQLFFPKGNFAEFTIIYRGKSFLKSLDVHFFNPGASEKVGRDGFFEEVFGKNSLEKTAGLSCPCPQPDFENRLDWCPSGNCPKDPSPSFTNVTHLIVHHSAGTNTATDWAAVVRSIWDFHVNVNQWDDIGYNWLVDPNGVLYEGRGDGVLGAHFCGKNGGTMGVCILGNFTNVSPTPAAIETLNKLLAWKACDADVEPLDVAFHASSGLNLNRISGHRDGCATGCPGNAFYPMLPEVRTSVETEIDDCQGVPSLVAPTNLNGGAVSQTQIQLTWQDNSSNETGFVVERSTNSNSNFFELTELPANTNSYTDHTVFADMGYFYRVKAVQGNISSGYSNEEFVATGSLASSEKLSGGVVRIFPNPVADEATVFVENQWMGAMQVAVFDGLGRQVKPSFEVEKRASAVEFSMDLKELAAGIFWVKIWQDERQWLGKLIRN